MSQITFCDYHIGTFRNVENQGGQKLKSVKLSNHLLILIGKMTTLNLFTLEKSDTLSSIIVISNHTTLINADYEQLLLH